MSDRLYSRLDAENLKSQWEAMMMGKRGENDVVDMTVPQLEAWKFRIAKLELRAGDMLVLKILRSISQAEAVRIAERFKELTGNECRVIVLTDGADLSVVRREEAGAPPPP